MSGGFVLSGCASSTHQLDASGLSDFQKRYAACLAEYGFEATPGSGGSLEAQIPASQEDVYYRARDACVASLGYDSEPQLTDDQLRTGYALMVEARQCLTTLGYDLPPEPSLQTYIDDGGAYTPFADLSNAALMKLDEIERHCPQPQLPKTGK